ncbi:hypothetical protein [Bradyrhizobium sp. P5_C11_2]
MRNAVWFSTGAPMTIFARARHRKKVQPMSILRMKRHANVALQGLLRDQNTDEEPNP